MTTRIFQVLVLVIVTGLVGTVAAGTRELTGKTDAKGLKSLRLDMHVGSIEVIGTAAEQIGWQLKLEPDDDGGWFSLSKDAQQAVDGATVRAVAVGDAWELEVELPRGSDFDDVEEHWIIEVPVRFAVVLEANVGEVTVRGVAGGVEAELNVGEMRIEVPRGDVRAQINVGELDVVSQTRSIGRVRLQSNVGDIDLRIAGKRIESDRYFAIGADLAVANEGEDDVEAEVNVGEVSVRIEQ